MVVGRETLLENGYKGMECGKLHFEIAEQFKYLGTVIIDSDSQLFRMEAKKN